jgi:hypothetical protein
MNNIGTWQIVFNVFIVLIGGWGGWTLRTFWTAITDLQKADTVIKDDLAHVRVLVAGQYITRDDHDRKYDALFVKLDRIYDKLDAKADK